ncbi:MAG: type 1 glutamine amidotransferase domain-containing protein [Myxococcota bacterium]
MTANTRLDGKRVALLAADGFEYIEFELPRAALRLAGAHVDVVSLHGGKIRGMNLTQPAGAVRVDKTLEEANVNLYDGLFITGGFIGPDLLRQSERARSFARAFDQAQKPIAALCHGPLVLISAELVAGRHLAAWPGIRDDVVHAGGIWHDEPLVTDRNWISSRGPQDLPRFISAMIELFATGNVRSLEANNGNGEDTSRRSMESSPKPERPSGFVVTAARLLPGPTVRTMLLGALGGAAAVAIARRV